MFKAFIDAMLQRLTQLAAVNLLTAFRGKWAEQLTEQQLQLLERAAEFDKRGEKLLAEACRAEARNLVLDSPSLGQLDASVKQICLLPPTEPAASVPRALPFHEEAIGNGVPAIPVPPAEQRRGPGRPRKSDGGGGTPQPPAAPSPS